MELEREASERLSTKEGYTWEIITRGAEERREG